MHVWRVSDTMYKQIRQINNKTIQTSIFCTISYSIIEFIFALFHIINNIRITLCLSIIKIQSFNFTIDHDFIFMGSRSHYVNLSNVFFFCACTRKTAHKNVCTRLSVMIGQFWSTKLIFESVMVVWGIICLHLT
jgi:hypothetical protein